MLEGHRAAKGRALFALGGAQFGLDYGISNRSGKLAGSAARATLEAAWRAGVDMVDLAPAYGDAEELVAAARPKCAAFRIVSKTLVGAVPLDAIDAQARRSAKLAGGSLDALLVHHGLELATSSGPALWDLMRRLRDAGVTKRIGFSAYVEDDPVALARRFQPDLVQLPGSLLDQRLSLSGSLAELKALGVEIHLRSLFLQGLLFMDPDNLPPKLASIGPRLQEIQTAIAAAGASRLEAAIGYGRSLREVDRLVIGASAPSELQQILATAGRPSPNLNWSALALDEDWAKSPMNWS